MNPDRERRHGGHERSRGHHGRDEPAALHRQRPRRRPKDSNGNPWTANYVISSGNLLADFRFNVTAESQGRLQVCRLYELTEDKGVRDMLSFLIARDTMHQNQWLAAIEELERDGLGGTPVPITFPQEREFQQVSYQFWNCSEGTESSEGRWARGPSLDGRGEFQYVADPTRGHSARR
ncbi:MAG TPA: manganese catalase family protein [Longimicrobiaceae bacterium]|nr:manganese catalase family protein [Longimicrobiaceae bacterium]